MSTMAHVNDDERFKLSPRQYVDLEEFGRIANPSGRINVPAPAVDPYEYAALHYPTTPAPVGEWPMGNIWDPYADDPDIATQYQDTDTTPVEAPPGTEPLNDTSTPKNTSTPENISTRGKGHIMAGETTITVIGNLTNDPELRFTPVSRGFGKTDGTPVANFTIASTPRTFDAASNEWKDGETLFLRASAWREMAENVAASLTKGSRVIVSGRLKSRSYETKDGEKRTAVELDVEEIGASLRYAEAKVTRPERSGHAAAGAGRGGSIATS